MYGTTIYTDNYSFSKLYNPEGYITGAVIPDLNNSQNGIQYNYFRKDHVGNIHEVWQASYAKYSGTVAAATLQRTSYYPSGLPWYETTSTLGSSVQPRKYGGKEYIEMGGLDEYDSQARKYYATLPSTPTLDPHCEKYYSTSPYAWCEGNPVKFVDTDGRDPGDFFLTANAAANDWGKFYNGQSITNGREYGSTIYRETKAGKSGYTYTPAGVGSSDGADVTVSSPPKGNRAVADIHSHGKYDEGFDNNNFSNKDKWGNFNAKIDGYLATTDGSLKKYDVKSAKTTVVNTKLPSDAKDPERKNNINPTSAPTSTPTPISTPTPTPTPLAPKEPWSLL